MVKELQKIRLIQIGFVLGMIYIILLGANWYLSRSYTYESMAPLFAEPSAEGLPYELKHNMNYSFRGNYCKINPTLILTDDNGFRIGNEHLEASNDSIKILGLGDSEIFGWGVEYNDTYLFKLKQIIEQTNGTEVDILNTGIPSFDTRSEYFMLKYKCLSYKPDVVILDFDTNDFFVTENYSIRVGMYDVNLWDKLIRKIPGIKVLSHTVLSSRFFSERLQMLINPDYKMEGYDYELVPFYMEQIAELVGKDKLFIVIPFMNGVELPDYERFKIFLYENNFNVIDETDYLLNLSEGELSLSFCDPHPTPSLHTLTAKAIFNDERFMEVLINVTKQKFDK